MDKLICDEVKLLNNTEFIYIFLLKNNIKFMENNNGIFFNLSLLSDDNKSELYDLIKLNKNLINKEEDELNKIILETEIMNTSFKSYNKTVDIEKNVNITLNNFNDNEKDIILLSKNLK